MKNIPNLFSHEVKMNLNKFGWFMSDAANDRRSLEHASVRHSRAPALSVTTANSTTCFKSSDKSMGSET